jgi:hypothetical protein
VDNEGADNGLLSKIHIELWKNMHYYRRKKAVMVLLIQESLDSKVRIEMNEGLV